MKSPRFQGTIVVYLGYDELNILDNTLIVRENWSAHFARVVAPCSNKARGDVGTFSSGDFPNVSDLKKAIWLRIVGMLKNISRTCSFLMR